MTDHEPNAEDIELPERDAAQVKGGLLLPAIQAAREAPRRSAIWDPTTQQSRQISTVNDV